LCLLIYVVASSPFSSPLPRDSRKTFLRYSTGPRSARPKAHPRSKQTLAPAGRGSRNQCFRRGGWCTGHIGFLVLTYSLTGSAEPVLQYLADLDGREGGWSITRKPARICRISATSYIGPPTPDFREVSEEKPTRPETGWVSSDADLLNPPSIARIRLVAKGRFSEWTPMIRTEKPIFHRRSRMLLQYCNTKVDRPEKTSSGSGRGSLSPKLTQHSVQHGGLRVEAKVPAVSSSYPFCDRPTGLRHWLRKPRAKQLAIPCDHPCIARRFRDDPSPTWHWRRSASIWGGADFPKDASRL